MDTILIDHVAQDARVRIGPSGQAYVVGDKGKATLIVCGDIVQRVTEDGPETGRCGLPVYRDFGQCERHADERIWWASLTERERAGIERIEDERAAMGRY